MLVRFPVFTVLSTRAAHMTHRERATKSHNVVRCFQMTLSKWRVIVPCHHAMSSCHVINVTHIVHNLQSSIPHTPRSILQSPFPTSHFASSRVHVFRRALSSQSLVLSDSSSAVLFPSVTVTSLYHSSSNDFISRIYPSFASSIICHIILLFESTMLCSSIQWSTI